MKNNTLELHIDPVVLGDAEAILSEMGLSVPSAVQLFLTQVVQHHTIPFKIKVKKPNWRTRAAFRETERMIKHPERYKSYSSHEEILKEALGENHLTKK